MKEELRELHKEYLGLLEDNNMYTRGSVVGFINWVLTDEL